MHPNAQLHLRRVTPSQWVIANQKQKHESSNHVQVIQSLKRKDAGEKKGHINMTSEPPKTIDTKHTSPLTTVIAPTFGGTTATAGDLPEPELPVPEMLELGLLDVWLTLELPRLLLLEEQEPRRKVGDGIEVMICAVLVLSAGKFVRAYPKFVCRNVGPTAVDEAPGIP